MPRFPTLLSWVAVAATLCRRDTLVEANNTAAIIQFINSITLAGRTLTTTGSTSEDKALKWLVTENFPQYQFVPGSTVNNTRLAQRYALATYYVDNARPRNEWLSNQSECTWFPVGCLSDSIVTSLGPVSTESSPEAERTVPIDMGLLSSLRTVHLYLNGTLPSSIGKWTELNSVRLSCGSYHFPSGCRTTLPTSIGDWRNIREVSFIEVDFFGTLPSTVGNWTNLQSIRIFLTSLNGTLPESIGNWRNVQSVSFKTNPFSSLPATIVQWSSLREFDVYDDSFIWEQRFSGSLPIGNWPNLTKFYVGKNRFTGTISPAVANWTSIEKVDLRDNNFIGTIPRSICSGRNLTELLADCPNEVACWCCTGCARPTITAGDMSGILFRELRADAQDGSWGPNSIDIPGFDHVAVSYLDSVFESHPGYTNGPVYVSADRIENRTIPVVNGVQNVHTIETFKHDSRDARNSPVIKFQVVSMDNATALAMKNIITPRLQVAGFLGFNSVEEFVTTHNPAAQKGGNGKFTGVGLIEWAAEQAGVNNGQGFVPNELESITTTNETFPLLSPELMYRALQNRDVFFSTLHFLTGYFDPVDHLLTDPLNRTTGIVNHTRYDTIPNAFYSPNGEVETLVVVNPLPGTYKLTVYGIPGKKGLAAVQVLGRPATAVRTTDDASSLPIEQSVVVPERLGSRGDVNNDGTINRTDLILLKEIISNATFRFVRTADMDGDGQLNQADVNILELYLNRITKPPTLSPIRAPVVIAPTPRAGDPPVPVAVPTLPPKRPPTPSPNRAPAAAPNRAPTPSPNRPPTPSPIRPPTPSPNRAPAAIVPAPRASDPSPAPPTPSPNRAAPDTPPGTCPASDKCNRGFMLHRTVFSSRCIQWCTSRLLLRWRLLRGGKAWKCGKCQK